jgi:phosphoribosylformylglycinamidine (FGAM) synthase-like enzyme
MKSILKFYKKDWRIEKSGYSDFEDARLYVASGNVALSQATQITIAVPGMAFVTSRVQNSSKRLGDEFKEFIDYVICVTKKGNTLFQTLTFSHLI